MFQTAKRISADPDKIQELLTRGVEEVIEAESLKKALIESASSGKPLRIKLGIDPTSPNIHIGRAVALRKLRAFQNLGHQVVFIVGDFTGIIGDTSDKDAERPMLTEAQVKSNLKNYFAQAYKILDKKRTEVYYNSKWLGKLQFMEIGKLADAFSVHDFISRELIKKRLTEGKRVSLREVLYPLMQGYDSVAVRADVELGGTDQKFNLLAGRSIQPLYKQKPQNILMTTLLEGLDGRKMSSSWGNVINITDTPTDMFGKVMSVRDELIAKYFLLTTNVSLEEIKKIENDIANGGNPRDAKMRLGRELVTLYHGEKAATDAEAAFIATFQKKEIPEDVLEITVVDIQTLPDIFIEKEIVQSKTEFRRLVSEHAITHLESDSKIEKLEDFKDGTYRIGKKRFVKIILSE